jgi:phosphatidylglycerophosphate synthase
VSQSLESENRFVVDLLTTLREERFSPLGWWRFLWRSWEMSCKTANDNPGLKRSWALVTVLVSILALAILLATFFFEGPGRTLYILPGFLFCVVWQQSDLFWHLGLNRQGQTGRLLSSVGIANTLTWLRGVGASYLLARVVGGVGTPSWLALIVFLVGVVTDILDGQVARITGTQSKLGQIGDGEVDFSLYLALAIILIQNAVLPLWLGLVMLLRFCVPLIAALASYFLFAHPVRFGSTVWGKYAGLAQCLYFLVLLAPPRLAPIVQVVNLPLLVATLILLVIAPLAQIVENVRISRMSRE